MVSLNNSTAASALSLLTGSNKALANTITKVASGKEVNSASDNAAYWAIATDMDSQGSALSSAQDATAFASATVDTARLGMQAATDIVTQIQSKLILAKSLSGSAKDAVGAEIDQLKQQLGTVAESTSFAGQNWLSTDAGSAPQTQSLVASATADSKGGIKIGTIDYDTAKSNLIAAGDAEDGLLTRSYSGTTGSGAAYDYHLIDANSTVGTTGSEISVNSSTTSSDLDGMIAATNSMLKDMTSAGASLGATSNRISSSSDFLQNLQDTIKKGIGRLVDANMEEQAVNLSAQKVQQQLQTIGLNIVNNQSKNLLSLFA
ncbi:flagellin [Rhizobium sp. NRK18]|uniref:flagellin N-terminal helical domain-containing protein n=1 Tax=Rhizobium sp. NRK18 TaxID=2964667 RepID=UPI0021C40438|nr:flagellin [Rhizobium sp. NRK18]MCQ2003591.1 flagellin [Rhizobium sp. NRK18]